MKVGLCFDHTILTETRYASRLAALDVLVFPELFDGGYASLIRGAKPHSPRGSLLQSFRKASSEFDCTLIGGSLHFQSPGAQPTNTTLVFRNGRMVHRYDKIHLFRPMGDHRYFSAGKKNTVFTVPCAEKRLVVGTILCFDLRFPELARELTLNGMQILFVPARWPLERDDAWFTLLKARAIENQIFVVGCNALGGEGGMSYIVDPSGKAIFTNRKQLKTPLHIVDLDLSSLETARSLHNNIKEALYLRARSKEG